MAGGKVLGVQNQSTADGAPVLQWDDYGTLDREWVTDAGAATSASGT
ncbi:MULTISPECIES: hypothetical protein [unclassified Streptomyces]|nr:hypothetical protein [Streptomyces sp. ST1015]